MLIKKAHKFDHMGLTRASRRWGVAPFFIRELKEGKIVELNDEKAQILVDNGYAIKVDKVTNTEDLSDTSGDVFNRKTPETSGASDSDRIEL